MILTVIGGGSPIWMQALMQDIYLLDEVTGGEIRLVDPHEEQVNLVADMLHVFTRQRGKDFAISVVPDRREALTGADFVLATYHPGTRDAFFNDLEIPIKYGIRQPVSVTVGPPGISNALRTVPVGYEIIQDMEEVCPDAWMFNLTNPMTAVTRAMNLAATQVKVFGMCHELHNFPRNAGVILGLPKPDDMRVLDHLYRWLGEQGLEFTVAGINHFIWLTEARLNGTDMLPAIHQFAAENETIGFVPDDQPVNANPLRNHDEAKLALCRHLGYLPLANDRHVIECIPSLCNIHNGFGMKYGVHKTTVDLRRHRREVYLARMQRIITGEDTPTWKTNDEELTSILRAILTGSSTPAVVNVPNQGQITNLPPDVVVETLGTVSADGITPKPSGELPSPASTLVRLHADVCEMTVPAALHGDRDLLVRALSLDPMSACTDFSQIEQMADELLFAVRRQGLMDKKVG